VSTAFSNKAFAVSTANHRPIVVFTIFLGYVLEPGKVRSIIGAYLEEERGFSSDSPCYVWLGPFKHGAPYVTTHFTTRSVRKMLAYQAGRKGRVYPACGFDDCVSPRHMGSVHYWKHQGRDEKSGRFSSTG
jgi:hypothetical protein